MSIQFHKIWVEQCEATVGIRERFGFTKMRLRLDQTLSSATADEGQTVELSVAEAVTVDGATVVQEGARATGTVVLAQENRRMGRAGKLDFSVDRVRGVDGQWLPVRYTLTKKQGDSKAV